MAKRSKDEMLNTLRSLAAELGKRTLSKRDVQAHIPLSSLRYHFGSLGNALEAAGLETTDCAAHLRDRAPLITDEELFRSLLEVEQRIGHAPGASEYSALGQYSPKPFRDRFGRWSEVMLRYRKWRAEVGSQSGHAGSTVSGGGEHMCGLGVAVTADAPVGLEGRGRRGSAQLYGEPIDFRGLRHAPTNEQGVVYLFGMVSRELGFIVESVQQGFPDCEAKYLHDRRQSLWAKARIEFEFRSSNFAEHGHPPEQCDLIVCWIHDWEACPVEVIELKSELRKLPNA